MTLRGLNRYATRIFREQWRSVDQSHICGQAHILISARMIISLFIPFSVLLAPFLQDIGSL